MRTQWCRDHIDETAEMCGLGEDVVSDVKRATEFCTSHPDMSECSTRAIMTLLRVKDEPVKDLAISLAINALNVSTPTGGKTHDRLTEPDIKKLIQKAKLEIIGESTKNDKQEIKRQTTNCTSQEGDLQNDELVPEQQPLSQVISRQEPASSTQASGVESDHDRRVRISGFLLHKQESNWKPRHIAREELISELTDQYLNETHMAVLQTLIDKDEAKDIIDAILWIVDRFNEMQDCAA